MIICLRKWPKVLTRRKSSTSIGIVDDAHSLDKKKQMHRAEMSRMLSVCLYFLPNRQEVRRIYMKSIRNRKLEISFRKIGVFLDAASHLYKRVCPSVRPYVRMLLITSINALYICSFEWGAFANYSRANYSRASDVLTKRQQRHRQRNNFRTRCFSEGFTTTLPGCYENATRKLPFSPLPSLPLIQNR